MKRFKFSFDNKQYIGNYITDIREADVAAMKLRDSAVQHFGIDIETAKNHTHPKAGLEPHLSKISTVQIYDGAETVWIFDALLYGLEWLKYLKDKSFVAHYGIFEIKHLTHNGFPDLTIGCSMLLSILVDRAERSPFVAADEVDTLVVDDEDEDEPSSWKGYGLDAIIGRLFNLRIDKKWQLYDWRTRPLPLEPLTYSALDAILTYKICEVQIPKVNEYKMQKHYRLLKEMQYVIADMELAGVHIDKPMHDSLINSWVKTEAKEKLNCIKHFGDLNLRSSKQLGAWAKKKYSKEVIDAWVKSKTTKALGFGKDALATMQHLPEIKALLTYKKTSKLISTYGTTLQAQVNPVTKRVHCSFSLGETRTGRLSSREPNLQNLPRDSGMRNIFRAYPGKKLIIADFNQIELRVAGEVSRDPVILNAYKEGVDLHRLFASKMYHVPISKVTKDQRQIAKSANFGAIYGMGPSKFITYTLASTQGELKISFDEAKHTIDSLWELYAGYAAYCKQVRHRAEIIGFVRTPLGKVRKLHPQEVYTKAPNTIVQGGAFEVMAMAMIEFRKKARILNEIYKDSFSLVELINSVHDEMIVEVDEDIAQEVKEGVEQAMEYGMLKVFPKATLNGLAVAKICDAWGEKE